jgi:Uma2 family endonuclease
MSLLSLPEPPLPPGANPEALYEIIRGNRVEFSKSAYVHWINSELYSLLTPFVRERRLVHVFIGAHFVIDPVIDQRRRADVAFVAVDRWPMDRRFPETGDWIMVPTRAVEVLSPTDKFEAVLEKLQEYFDYSVKQVWLVVPNVRKMYIFDSPIRVRILTDADTLNSTVVPGFTLAIGELFQKST